MKIKNFLWSQIIKKKSYLSLVEKKKKLPPLLEEKKKVASFGG